MSADMKTAAPKAIRWTREEYYRMAEAGLFDGRRVELVRGEVIEMTPQKSRHATGVTLVYTSLSAAFGDKYVARIQLPLILGLDSDPEPDAAVVPGNVRDFVDAHPSTATLVVEVADSSLDYDRTTKCALYAESGIPEYWIVNLVERQLEVYRKPEGGAYGERLVLGPSESVEPLSGSRVRVLVADLLP